MGGNSGRVAFFLLCGGILCFCAWIMNFLERRFKIARRGSSVRTEVVAGITTFAAMSYILAVNPIILSSTGMDRAALVTVTGLTALIGSVFMGLYSNLPIALAPGMGTNTYFALIICAGMGLSWQSALALTFYNGIIFFVISIVGIREKIIRAVPAPLQIGLQCGIGLFIAFMGLQHAGLVVSDPATMVSIGNMLAPKTLIAALGFIAMACMVARGMKGAIIFTILAVTLLCMFVRGPSGEPLAAAPESVVSLPASFSQTFFALDFGYPFRDPAAALPVIFTLLLLDMFDTIGTVIALGRRTGMMNARGEMAGLGKALQVDSSCTVLGALMGTSTVTCYAESAAGVEAGGRTGLSAAVAGLCFLGALFFAPLICSVPEVATAPALIFVGIMMMSGISKLDFSDFAQSVPAIFCMLMIMLTFSITRGFSLGIFMYVVMMSASGRARSIGAPAWMLFAVMVAFIFGVSLR